MMVDDTIRTSITDLRQPEDVMKFFDDFIAYGCIDVDAVKHIDSLGGESFRAKYRTLGLEESLNQQIGACIEQTNITKYLLDKMGITSRTFCTRGYNEVHNAPDDLYLVHCYTLAYFGDKVLNIEHSDSELRGIYTYDSAEEAIRETHKLFSDKFIRHGATQTTLDEYTESVPGGLSFLDFNRYMTAIALHSDVLSF